MSRKPTTDYPEPGTSTGTPTPADLALLLQNVLRSIQSSGPATPPLSSEGEAAVAQFRVIAAQLATPTVFTAGNVLGRA